ncbi:Lipopolysaccharide export system protein LptA [hydrothermal vent metagenome]|uniref:Lipopolysaccharide export system protein LptA n=1 Tax=hydrothermal vent metagenome TaxID=652676 RepID=A0A3B0TJ12_9ZZZZ
MTVATNPGHLRKSRRTKWPWRALAFAFGVTLLGWSSASAQGLTGSLSAMRVDTNAPIRIESDSLEVDEKAKLAVFAGKVTVTQERMRLTAGRLEIRYTPGANGQPTQLRTVDALGGVRMSLNDQVATGSRAHYNLATEIMTLSGDVVLSQGENVIRGDQLEVNLKTGKTRVISSATSANKGRVRGLFKPNRLRRQ